MRKLRSGIILLSLVLLCCLLSSCFGGEVNELTDEGYAGYYYESSDGIISITNYHPYKLNALPSLQELVQYGDGAGLENEGIVYFVYIVDTSVEPNSKKAYYSAEFDGETGELLTDDGEYFPSEEAKTASVERLLNIIKAFTE